MSGDENLTSSTLLDRARSREESAWQRLVSLYTPLVYYWCRTWGLQPAQVEDVGQDVFLAVHRALPKFERNSAGSFRGWLRTIARNKLLDHAGAARHSQGRGGSDAQRRLATLPAPLEDESEELLSEERRLLYRQAVNLIRGEFSERDWQAFWKSTVEGIPPAEVAAALETTANVVYLARARIRKRVREEFGELVETEE